MSISAYSEYIYQVIGEKIALNPKTIFDSVEVYLIIDIDLKIIWIWAGNDSRLFHRYMAANWAGKLKSKSKCYNFRYEVIKEGREPLEFTPILKEIKEKRKDLSYPGQSRGSKPKKVSSTNIDALQAKSQDTTNILIQSDKIGSNGEKARIKSILGEIKDIQMQIKYSLEHIEKRIQEIEKIVEK